MSIYRLTRQAEADLKDIYRSSQRTGSHAQAARYAHQMQECLELLTERPHTGTRREGLWSPNLYSFVYGSHVIFYQPQPYGVLIVRVLHDSQDVRRHLNDGADL